MGINVKIRKRAAVVPIVAGLVAMAAIAFALVVVQVTGTVSSNEFIPATTTTTTSPPPSGDGLEAAVADGPGQCDPALAAGTTSLGQLAIDLNSSGVQGTGKALCVRNIGPGDITDLTLNAETALSTENGCSVAEGAVDPEGAGCGSSGELDGIVAFRLTKQSGAGICQPLLDMTPGTTLNLLQGGGLTVSGECIWSIELRVDGSASEDAKLAASTDLVDFTFDVSGSGTG
jgi:hypothetical protein